MLALLDGRYPKAPDEVALTDDAASLLSAHIGERVELGGVARTVVGMVENPTELDDEFALVAPGRRHRPRLRHASDRRRVRREPRTLSRRGPAPED